MLHFQMAFRGEACEGLEKRLKTTVDDRCRQSSDETCQIAAASERVSDVVSYLMQGARIRTSAIRLSEFARLWLVTVCDACSLCVLYQTCASEDMQRSQTLTQQCLQHVVTIWWI